MFFTSPRRAIKRLNAAMNASAVMSLTSSMCIAFVAMQQNIAMYAFVTFAFRIFDAFMLIEPV